MSDCRPGTGEGVLPAVPRDDSGNADAAGVGRPGFPGVGLCLQPPEKTFRAAAGHRLAPCHVRRGAAKPCILQSNTRYSVNNESFR